MLVEVASTCVESEGQAVSFEKAALKEDVVSKVSSKSVL